MNGIDDEYDPQAQQRSDERLTEMLTQLADDPDAPPSSVSALSVIAAAKAEARAARESAGAAGSAPTAARPHRLPRRRFLLGGLVAAAALAAVAAVVIPVTLSGSSSNTSANSAKVATTSGPIDGQGAAAQSAAAAAPAPTAGTGASSGQQDAGAAVGGSADTGREQSAAGEAFASGSGCWPDLSGPAVDAVLAALPPGQFSPPVPLAGDCGSDPVAGAVLAGTAPGTVLVVRVSRAEPGACADGGTEAGVSCVQSAEGVYLSTDSDGQVTAFAYGNGYEVAVGGWSAIGDSVAIGSGLTDEELVSAAQAVLGVLS